MGRECAVNHGARVRAPIQLTGPIPITTEQLPPVSRDLTGTLAVLTIEKIAVILPMKQSSTNPSGEKFVSLPVVFLSHVP
jgi:hypothetical protein